MRITPRILSVAAVAVAVSGFPVSSFAQGAVAEQLAQAAPGPQPVRLDQLLGITNPDQLVATLSSPGLAVSVLSDPTAVRMLAERIGQLAVAQGAAGMTLVERTIAVISARTGGSNVAVLQTFAAGVSGSMIRSGGSSQDLMISLTAAMVAGAGKDEATVGLVSRAVSSGVVATLVQTGTPAPEIAGLVQAGVSQGATKVVGSNIIVQVDTTDDKPVSDVTLLRQGTALSKGADVQFVTVQAWRDQIQQIQTETAQTVASPS